MENPKYYLKNISFSFLKNGRYVGNEEYEMEIRYKNVNNESYKKYFSIFYDEEEKPDILPSKCWHCKIPFININYKVSYLKNDFHLLKLQENHGYICKNCYFFLNLYDYNRDFIFRCASCSKDFNIIYANAIYNKCFQTYFDAYYDLLCLRCNNYSNVY